MGERRSSLLRASAIYLFIAALLGFLSFATEVTVGDVASFLPYVPEGLAPASIRVVLIPVLVSITFFYATSITGALFEGELTRVIISLLYAGGFASLILVFMVIQPTNQATRGAGLLLMACYLIYFAYSILSTLARLRGQFYLRVIPGALSLFIYGQILIQIVDLYTHVPGVPESEQVALIKNVLGWGSAAASLISLVAIFRDSRNPYVAQIGDVASNYFFVVSVSIIGTLYYYFVTGAIAQVNPVVEQLSPYVEWTGVVVLGAFIFQVIRRGMMESMMTPVEAGRWGRHIQDVSTTKGRSLQEFSQIVEEFIQEGSKERLLVRLFQFLSENRASEREMVESLEGLIKYQDESPPYFSRRGTGERVEALNRERRLRVLEEAVERIMGLGLGGVGAEVKEER